MHIVGAIVMADEEIAEENYQVGWTLGGGLEYKFSQNVSVGAEYLYWEGIPASSSATMSENRWKSFQAY